jgi:hypothetical protein
MTREDDRLGKIWPALEPSPGFPGRVLEAFEGGEAREAEALAAQALAHTRRRRTLAAAVGGVAFGALAVGAVMLLVGRTGGAGPGHASSGRLVAGARQSVGVGSRAVAVAERGAEISWSLAGEDVRVEQPRGSVFYRVEHGGDFLVSTPAGDVRVTGTCFAVSLEEPEGEVEAAARHARMVVAVYEGSVRVWNQAGAVSLMPGEGARVLAGAAPVRMDPAPWSIGLAADAGGDQTTSLRASRGREASVQARVRQLEQDLAEARLALDEDSPGQSLRKVRKYFDLTQEERRMLAQNCELRYALPGHLKQMELPTLDDDLGLTEQEKAAVVRVMEEQRNSYLETLRGLYIEVVGDRNSAMTLSPLSLQLEIEAKAPSADDLDARRRILEEWAGLTAPPASPAGRPPVERFVRLLVGSADTFLARLTDVVGAERAFDITRRSSRFLVGGRHAGYCPRGIGAPTK